MIENDITKLDKSTVALLEQFSDPLIDKINELPVKAGIMALGYIVTVLWLEAKPAAGKNRLDTFDIWVKSVRRSIELNETKQEQGA